MKIQGGIIESVPVNATSARFVCIQFFFNENVSYPVWTCREPISLILGTRFSIQGTRIGSLKHLKKLVYLSPCQDSATRTATCWKRLNTD